MDKELEKYYESYLDLFVTDGWKNFVEDFQLAADNLSDVRNVATLEDMKLVQGKLDVMDRIINFETGIRNAYDEYLNDSQVWL